MHIGRNPRNDLPLPPGQIMPPHLPESPYPLVALHASRLCQDGGATQSEDNNLEQWYATPAVAYYYGYVRLRTSFQG